MSTFVLKIEFGNDAMQSSEDLSIALKKVAYCIIKNDIIENRVEYDDIRDTNGNTVGDWQIGYDENPEDQVNEDDEEEDLWGNTEKRDQE